MEYLDVIEWMESRKEPKGEYTIENAKALLRELGSPEDKINTIHVAGTNGKGSTCAYLESSIRVAGKKCGLFISPFIEDIRESISINEENISEKDFYNILIRIREIVIKLDEKGFYPTYFDILTAAAFVYFYEEGVDCAVIEVGMGGRLDSTNVISKPLASVIVSISKDHTNFLGNTLSEIAGEKAGIIKEGVPVFSYKQEPEVVDVLCKRAKEKLSPIQFLNLDEVKNIESKLVYNKFDFIDFKDIQTKIAGKHQVYNASLAIMVLNSLKDILGLSKEDIVKGILEAKNKARIETILDEPHIIIDGCHNRESVEAFVDFIESNLKNKNLVLGFSVLKDKEHNYIIKQLSPYFKKIVLTEIENDRALDIDSLYNETIAITDSEVWKIKDNREAFEKTVEFGKGADAIIWCGSLYLMKNIRKYACELAGELV